MMSKLTIYSAILALTLAMGCSRSGPVAEQSTSSDPSVNSVDSPLDTEPAKTSEPTNLQHLSDCQHELQGVVLSWAVDSDARLFRARVHNDTPKTVTIRMDPHNLEAIITVTPHDGSAEMEFAQQDYYRKLLVGFWIPPELKIPANSSFDWALPFAELQHMEYDSKVTFDAAAVSGDAQISSIHGLNYKYDNEGRFDGFN